MTTNSTTEAERAEPAPDPRPARAWKLTAEAACAMIEEYLGRIGAPQTAHSSLAFVTRIVSES